MAESTNFGGIHDGIPKRLGGLFIKTLKLAFLLTQSGLIGVV